MTSPRDLIREARGGNPFAFQRDRLHALVLRLADALEDALDGERPAIKDDEAAIRHGLDEGLRLSLFAWADLMEEAGHAAEAAAGMRWLARQGKWPGAVNGAYRWMGDRADFGPNSSASWSLPARVLEIIHEQMQKHKLSARARPTWESCSGALLWAADGVGRWLMEEASKPKVPKSEVGHDPF